MKTNLVTIQEGKAVTSSLQVAQVFGKEHHHVLRDIRNLDCSSQFKESNFGCSFYISELHNGGQKKQPLYYMTKDGFTFLVMGFTGKKAGKFKEDYINAFNQMELTLKSSNGAPTRHLEKEIDYLKQVLAEVAEDKRFYRTLAERSIHSQAVRGTYRVIDWTTKRVVAHVI